MSEAIKLKGYLSAILKKANGETEKIEKDNIILNAGFDYICDAIGKASARPNVMGYIAVGTGTTTAAVGQTALISELTRKAATYSHTTGTKLMTFTTKFEAGQATGAITEAGLVNAASGGTFLDRLTFDVINKGINDDLTMTFQFTLS